MSRDDRSVRRARRFMEPEEALVASAVGYEHDGRRRRVVLLTDRRVLITDPRAEHPLELGLTTASAAYEPDGGLLELHQDGRPHTVLRDVEAAAATQIVALLTSHRTMSTDALAPRVRHVHLRPHGPPRTGPSDG